MSAIVTTVIVTNLEALKGLGLRRRVPPSGAGHHGATGTSTTSSGTRFYDRRDVRFALNTFNLKMWFDWTNGPLVVVVLVVVAAASALVASPKTE